MLLKAVMNMGLQLFDRPGPSCDPDDGHVEVTASDHRLQSWEDLLIRKVASDAKEDETV